MVAESIDALKTTNRTAPINRPYTITRTLGNVVTLTPTDFQRKLMATTFNMTTDTPPASLVKAEIVFDIGKCIGGGNPNLNVNFVCGLSRFCNTPQRNTAGFIGPSYFQWDDSTHTRPTAQGGTANFLRIFADFVVVNSGGELRLFDTTTNGLPPRQGVAGARLRNPRWREIDYTQGGTQAAPFNVLYDTTNNASSFEKVKFILDGERVKIVMIDNTRAEVTLYEYSQTRRDGVTPRLSGEIMKPIDQGCEAMMPVMGIHNFDVRGGGNDADDYAITLSEYNCVNLTDIPNVAYTTDLAVYEGDRDRTIIPWYNLVEQGNRRDICRAPAGALQISY